ncbi:PAS domain S-box protein [Undibacterium sp. CY7W]|uniref:histidine kinase n=1 Tax=Undibacterium rugosum TaxID=2762291 RepID=A0A923I188_9BURK|nr:ATP-binding protein [Undibacterium rugosum]MBC3934632.1 PAS domain S-box protein [Undibacterium rugosum]
MKQVFSRFQHTTLLAVTLLIIAVIVTQTYLSMREDRKLTLDAERSNAHVAVRILEEHVAQTMQDGVQKLDAVAAAVSAVAHDPRAIQKVLTSYDIQDNRYIKSLRYIDLGGNSWVSSPDFPTHTVNVADRQDVRFLLNAPDYGEVVIGRPYQSPYDSQLVLPIARNIFDRHQQQVGIISTDIRIAYFAGLYASVASENNAMVALILDPGYVVIRSPFEARFADRDVSQANATKKISQSDIEGSFEDADWLDDEFLRLYAYRKVEKFPLTIVYGRDFDSMLAQWTQRMETRAALTGLVVLILTFVMWALAVQMRKLRQSEATLRTAEYKFSEIFERSPLPLSLVNLHGRKIDAVNDAWLHLFAFRREQVLDHSFSSSEHIWIDRAQMTAFTELLRNQSQVDFYPAQLRDAHGNIHDCLLSARRYEADGEERFIITPQDVTRQNAAEAALRELNEDLEQRVARRTENLERSNLELEEALQSLRLMQTELIRQEKLASLGSLVAGVAHELNTPIGNSVTVASTLQDDAKRIKREVEQGQIKRSSLNAFADGMLFGTDVLMRSLTRASELIRSFKHVAVDQSSDMRRQFDLLQVLEEILLTNSSMYAKTPFQMRTTLEPGITMNSFPGALGQIIGNFVSNAMTHAFEGRSSGSMHLMARCVGELAVIEFRDDGNGISAENLSKVFDPFFTTKFGQGGSGLGMNIVYNLATEVLGGRIDLHSAPGLGTCFTLTLPLIAPDSELKGK